MTTPQCRMTALPSTEDLARLAKAIPAGPWIAVSNHPTNACAHVLQDVDSAIDIATLFGNHDDVPAPSDADPWADMPIRDATAEAIAHLPALLREVLDRREAEASANGRAVMTIYACPTPQEITAWAESALRNVPDGSLTRDFMRELIADFADGLSALRATPTTEASHGE